jgi:DNA segregation ATPase FtsK/SpoIIIE-like protein
MTEAEFSELEPYYEEAKVAVPTWPQISVTAVQRNYVWGYNRACRLLEALAEHGHLNYDRKTGTYSAART